MKPALTLVVLSEHEGDSIYMITCWLLWRPVIFWTTMKEWIVHMHMTSMLLTQINPRICNSYLIPIYINSNTPPTSSPKKNASKHPVTFTNGKFQFNGKVLRLLWAGRGSSSSISSSKASTSTEPSSWRLEQMASWEASEARHNN